MEQEGPSSPVQQTQPPFVEEEDLKASPQHQWTDSSEGDVGSLIDCLEDEEEDEEEEDEPNTSPEAPVDVVPPRNSSEVALPGATVDYTYAEKYRQQRLKEAAEHQMAKPPQTSQKPPPLSTPRPDGIAFNLNEPWQRSMMKQLEHPDFARPTQRGCDRIFVGHTESRDYAVSWDDEASTFSLDTTASSIVPMRVQSIHRMSAAPRVVGYQHNPDRGTYTAGTPDEKPEGRDDSTSTPLTTSPRTVTDPPVVRKNMGKYVSEQQHMDDSYTAMPDASDPACYCLGYNMLDYLLIGGPAQQRRSHRRSLRPMKRVVEEEASSLEHLPRAGGYVG